MKCKRKCRHCGEHNVNRPRGLCWGCYYAPGVLQLYPSTSKYARRGVGNFSGASKMPQPTGALPGTRDKIEILAERARLGQSLFHPADAHFENGALVSSVPGPTSALRSTAGRE